MDRLVIIMEITNYAVTVVITAYNLEKYIDSCFDGLVSQDMQDFDVLFVNDASTDKTMEMVSRWKEHFKSRLHILDLDNNTGMPALARNAALDSGLIDGEYVLFIDGDDLIENNMLSKLYNTALQGEKADVCICAFDRIDKATGKRISTDMKGFPSEYFITGDDDMLAFINTSPWNKLWNYDVIRELRYPSFKVGEEVSFNFRGYMAANKIRFIDDVLIHYMVHRDSVISNTEEKTIWDFAEDLKKLEREVPEKYKNVVQLIIFIHIGLSMATRACENDKVDFNDYSKKINLYFNEFRWFEGNDFLSFMNLSRRGLKGICIWLAFLMYKFRGGGKVIRVGYKLSKRMRF